MSIRPGRAKGPYIGTSGDGGSGAPVDAQYVVVALDGTLTAERRLQVGAGLTLTDGGANGDITVALDDSRTGADCGNNTFNDDFDTEKPFWENTDVLTSLDWEIDTANGYLEGIAENNVRDSFYYGIEGDFDVWAKFTLNSATSCKFWAGGNSRFASIDYVQADDKVVATLTSESDTEVTSVDVSSLYLRIRRVMDTLYYYYKESSSDPWTLVETHTDSDLGHDVTLYLDSGDTAYMEDFHLCANTLPQRVRSASSKLVTLTDAATIAVDASLGNIMAVTLGGNRTLGNPTNPSQGQMLLFRVEQDGTGSRTLSYSADYRFSTDLPSPTLSTGAGDIDYLLFAYHESDDKWDFIGKVFGF